MVGHEEGHRGICRYSPFLHCSSECRGFGKARVGLSECRHWALASQSFAAYANSKNQTPAEAYASAGLYDAGSSGEVFMEGPENPTLGEVLFGRVVHGK
jgi:hypothetical protein